MVKEELENNQIISEFIGEEKDPSKLTYHSSYDSLMPVIEHIHLNYLKRNIEGRKLQYTINYLLDGGYRFDNGEEYNSVEFSLKNLYKRVVLYIQSIR